MQGKKIKTFLKKLLFFFKKAVIFFWKFLIFLKNVLVFWGEIPDPTRKLPPQSFAKLLLLLPPFPLKAPWAGRFIGWWQHFFYMVKRVAVTTLPLFYPKKVRQEGEETGGGGWPNTGKRVGIQAHSIRKPDRQNIVHQQTRHWLQPDGNLIADRQNWSFNPTEPVEAEPYGWIWCPYN